jgi:hypothetical protein
MKAKVLVRSITTESCKGVDPEGNPSEGRHWHQGSVVELSDAEFTHFARTKITVKDSLGAERQVPCIEKVVERGKPVAAEPEEEPAPPPQDVLVDEKPAKPVKGGK